MMKVKSIELNKIEQIENSRAVYKDVDLAELMSSMRKNGLLEPIGVREVGNGKYEAVFGNRRIVAAKKLDWSEIDAHIMTGIETDVDRDILGLIENFKRQNTSVQEDARMFQSLIDRGLNTSEIAARLDVHEQRVKTALEVMQVVQEELRSKVVYSTRGRKRLAGQIPASTAASLLNMRRRHGLNRKMTRDLFKYASDKNPSINQILKIGPLLKEGKTVYEAIEMVSDLEHFSVSFYIRTKDCEKLEKKYKKPVSSIIQDFVTANPEFKIYKAARGPEIDHIHSDKVKTILRKGA